MAALHVDMGWVPSYCGWPLWIQLGVYCFPGLMLIAAYAVMLIASVFLAGVLVDVPWMLLPFFGRQRR